MSDHAADCGRFGDVAAELALGLLTGRERAEASAHLQRCPGCWSEVARLTAVHDGLRALVPPAEPPVGFEERVLRRIGRHPEERRARPAWGVRPVAAAAAVVALVFGGGWAVGTLTRPAPAPAAAAPLMIGDRHVGDVVASRERPDMLSVYLQVAQPGTLTCQLLRADGSVAVTESYEAARGTDWWAVQRPDATVTSIRVADAAGALVAGGRLPSA